MRSAKNVFDRFDGMLLMIHLQQEHSQGLATVTWQLHYGFVILGRSLSLALL